MALNSLAARRYEGMFLAADNQLIAEAQAAYQRQAAAVPAGTSVVAAEVRIDFAEDEGIE